MASITRQAGIFNALIRSNLVTRLLVLVLVATLPAFAVLLSLQHEVREERLGRARVVARQQAALLDRSLMDVMTAVQGLFTAVSREGSVAALEPGCSERLDAVRAVLPIYTSLSVLRADGTLVCSSASAPLLPGFIDQIGEMAMRPAGFAVGRYASMLPASPVLTVALVWPGAADRPGGAIVGGISLQWLSQRIQPPLHEPNAGLLVADGGGTILTNVDADAPAAGSAMPPAFQRLFAAPSAGTELGQDAEGAVAGMQRVVGFMPPERERYGLFIAVSLDASELSLGLNGAATRGYVLLGVGAALSVLLALLGAQRYLRNPTAVLLRAAGEWAGGALNVRAKLPPACPSEFNQLAHAFNRMAEMLQQQRTELQRMNDALELRVAERTDALLSTNNRLQVEIAERELTEANLRQVQKLQAVGQLAAGIAHNFNNVLGAMLGSTELLQKRLAGADSAQIRLLEIAKAAVARGSWLTSQLLAFSRKQPMVAAPVNMADAIGGVEALLRNTLGPGTRIVVRAEPELWAALIDANQFEVAVLNLALNAREAMPDGGRLTIAASNTTVALGDIRPDLLGGDYVQVEVADTGHGMTPEIVARAFEPFFTTKSAGQSAGLGLSQVHGMATQLGGAVTIDSRPGAGTRVSIMLPRSTAMPKDYLRETADSGRAALSHDQWVLLVDDDDEVREVTAGILEEVGYSVVAAADGAAALAVMDKEGERVALVIADYAMPGMTGLELLTTIRRRRPGMPMLLATGYADHQSLSGDGLESDQIVRKPFRSAELLGRIEMVLERQAALAE